MRIYVLMLVCYFTGVFTGVLLMSLFWASGKEYKDENRK